MTLYEIDKEIESLLQVDEETGEVYFDETRFAELQAARNDKIENIALWVKDLRSDAAALKAEEDALSSRRKAVQAKEKSLTAFLDRILDGEKFTTPRAAVSFRNTTSVEIRDDEFFGAAGNVVYIRQKPEPDKVAIKNALKEGWNIPGASLKAGRSMTIK